MAGAGLAAGVGLCILLELLAAPPGFRELCLILPSISSLVVLLACAVSLAAGYPWLGAEIPILLGLNLSASIMLLRSADLQSFFLNLELQSLSTLALLGPAAQRNKLSGVAVRYFLLGSSSSALLALSISLVYALLGTLSFSDLALALCFDSGAMGYRGLASIGLFPAALSAGFKLGLFPFHAWVLDVFSNLPLPLSIAVTSVGKVPGLLSFQRLFTFEGCQSLPAPGSVLVLLSMASILYGFIGLLPVRGFQSSLGWLTVGSSGVASLAVFQSNALGAAAGATYVLAGFPAAIGILGVRFGVSFGRAFARQARISGYWDPHIHRSLPGVLVFSLAALLSALCALPPSLAFFGKTLVMLGLQGRGLAVPVALVVSGGLFLAFFSLRLMARLTAPGAGFLPGQARVGGLRVLGYSLLCLAPFLVGLPALSDLVLGFGVSMAP